MIFRELENTIREFKMLQDNDRVVVAVSGGADSVFLTYALKRLQKRQRLYLHLAHLNHLLRKNEAGEDAFFVRSLAGRLKLSFSAAEIDVREFARKHGLSIEEAARKARYDFLLRVARANVCSKVALGHNQDDQAETVLMRFLRGSGLAGLRGIPPTRRIEGCLIIRPLIRLWRSDIEGFLKKKCICFRTDSSNSGTLFFRNRIRNLLLPELMQDFNPKIKHILINFAQGLNEDFDFLNRQSEDKFRSVCIRSAGPKIKLNIKKFRTLHKAMQRLILRRAIKELKGNLRRIDYRHWQELDQLTYNRPKNSIVDLPAQISVLKQGDKLIFYNRIGK